jgi:hypothetical protein
MARLTNEYIGDYELEGPLPSWPASDSNGTISESGYNQRLNYRLTSMGRELDKLIGKVSNEKQGREWKSLKDEIARLKRQSNVYSKVDQVIAFERKARRFAGGLG